MPNQYSLSAELFGKLAHLREIASIYVCMYVYDAQIMVWERSYSSVEMKVKK
jgi:hypothetical protein